MAYKALYRTYRPSTFSEVAGQKHIVRTLENALKTNKIAHAYLFCGPRGTGKTTMAKLFAKALNCEEGFGHQCNRCENCLGVSDGTHPDVIEIDAASNNGVEEVRDLIERVKYLPIKGKYKVYIIDEVHMMTSGAFNALLKTLEEPPAHVVFILATTEPHKVIPTIISRCQRYDFTKVEDDAIRQKMIEILDKEKITYDLLAINAIIDLADGGVRDALSILDHVLAYAGTTIKEKDVFDLFGLASTKEKLDLLKSIAKGDVKDVLKRMESFIASGIDIKRLAASLLDVLKDTLIFAKTKEDVLLTSLGEREAQELVDLIDVSRLNEMIEILLKAQNDFKIVSNVRSLFELVLLRLATDVAKERGIDTNKAGDVPSAAPILKRSEPRHQPEGESPKVEVDLPKEAKPSAEALEDKAAPEANGGTAPSWLLEEEVTLTSDDRPSAVAKPEAAISLNVQKSAIETSGDKNVVEDETMIQIMVLGNKEERQVVGQKWQQLSILATHPKLGHIASLLKDGRPYIVAKNVIILEYDFDCLADRVNIITNQEPIAEVIKSVVGRPVFVYAVVRSEAVRLQKAFFGLRQLNRLPKPQDIILTFKGAIS